MTEIATDVISPKNNTLVGNESFLIKQLNKNNHYIDYYYDNAEVLPVNCEMVYLMFKKLYLKTTKQYNYRFFMTLGGGARYDYNDAKIDLVMDLDKHFSCIQRNLGFNIEAIGLIATTNGVFPSAYILLGQKNPEKSDLKHTINLDNWIRSSELAVVKRSDDILNALQSDEYCHKIREIEAYRFAPVY